MSPRSLRSSLPAALATLAFLAGAAAAAPDSTAASPRRGNLFSAVVLADSALGREWAALRDEATARFPGLRWTQVADLHVTVVYIGPGWKTEDLERIRAHALVAPAVPVRVTPEVVTLGRNSQVVAVELHPASAAWGDSVVAAKLALNGLGLKRPDRYDADFRAHVTLAHAAHDPPTAADSTALAAFRSWVAAKVAADSARFSATLGPATRVSLLLAGTARPEGAPEYVTVEDFLARQRWAR